MLCDYLGMLCSICVFLFGDENTENEKCSDIVVFFLKRQRKNSFNNEDQTRCEFHTKLIGCNAMYNASIISSIVLNTALSTYFLYLFGS